MDLQNDDSLCTYSLKRIEWILTEEDAEENRSLFHDSLALQAMEKSFYQVLCKKRAPSAGQCRSSASAANELSNDDCIPVKGSGAMIDQVERSSLQMLLSIQNGHSGGAKGVGNSSVDHTSYSKNFPLSKDDICFFFRKGAEEASKFLPQGNFFMSGLSTCENSHPLIRTDPSYNVAELGNDGSSGSKNYDKRQLVTDAEDDGLSDLFDRLFLGKDRREMSNKGAGDISSSRPGKQKELDMQILESGNSAKTSNCTNKSKRKVVEDLQGLLIQCALALSFNNRETAVSLLRKIRQHSSPSGDGSQRLAHYFADSLEARLAGTGAQLYARLHSMAVQSVSEAVKAHEQLQPSCPYWPVASHLAYHHIFSLAEKSTKLHVIDFGISTGLFWVPVIRHLSSRPGGPPKLHITGTNMPAEDTATELVEKTGYRLAKYCERYDVPFEYTGITRKWESIRIKDLKIAGDEAVAVICMLNLEKLLDVVDEVNSQRTPREAVLSLIREVNPDIFIHFVSHGSYNTPEFYQRFRNALFHYSSLFDMMDANLARENECRQIFERNYYGRELMNIIACEGSERVERADTYKQWQTKIIEAGFRQLPLDRELVRTLCDKMKPNRHKDFMIQKNGNWILLGWKGRTHFAVCCYVMQTTNACQFD